MDVFLKKIITLILFCKSIPQLTSLSLIDVKTTGMYLKNGNNLFLKITKRRYHLCLGYTRLVFLSYDVQVSENRLKKIELIPQDASLQKTKPEVQTCQHQFTILV